MAKICNNMLLGISMVGSSEAMALGVRFVPAVRRCVLFAHT